MSFNQFILREQYRKVRGLGDRLELMKEQMNWKPFIPLFRKFFMAMKRNTRGRKINGGEQKRNRMISRIRSPGERPFGVIKRVFNGGRTFVKRLARVKIKEIFKCFAFGIQTL